MGMGIGIIGESGGGVGNPSGTTNVFRKTVPVVNYTNAIGDIIAHGFGRTVVVTCLDTVSNTPVLPSYIFVSHNGHHIIVKFNPAFTGDIIMDGGVEIA